MKDLLEWLQTSRWTVCDELHRQGYLTKTELRKDKAYGGKRYTGTQILIYRICIIPVVLLMRVSPSFTHIIWKITHKIWLRNML